MITVIWSIDSLTNLNESLAGVKIRQLIVRVLDDRTQFVTQTKIEGQPFGYTPVILCKQREAPVVNVTCGIADEESTFQRRASEEVLDRGRSDTAVVIRKCSAADEFKPSASTSIGTSGETVVVKFASEFYGMFANRVRYVVDKLHPLVGPLNFRPVESTYTKNRESIKAIDVDARQPAVERISHSGVQAVVRGGRSWSLARSAGRGGCNRNARFVDPLRMVLQSSSIQKPAHECELRSAMRSAIAKRLVQYRCCSRRSTCH